MDSPQLPFRMPLHAQGEIRASATRNASMTRPERAPRPPNPSSVLNSLPVQRIDLQAILSACGAEFSRLQENFVSRPYCKSSVVDSSRGDRKYPVLVQPLMQSPRKATFIY